MAHFESGTLAQAFVESIQAALSDALSRAFASTWKGQIETADAAADSASAANFPFILGGNLQGEISFQLKDSDLLLLSQKVLGQSAQEISAEHKDAVAKLLQDAMTAATVAMKDCFGELRVQTGSQETTSTSQISVRITLSDAGNTISIGVRLTPELMSGLEAIPAAPSAAAQTVGLQSPGAEGSLDRLLGVDLSLSLRFGQRSLTLREILDLNSGSVVELDRRVEEPAELFLDGRLIARGDVVVVDGNYGLRVTEVLTNQPRA